MKVIEAENFTLGDAAENENAPEKLKNTAVANQQPSSQLEERIKKQ